MILFLGVMRSSWIALVFLFTCAPTAAYAEPQWFNSVDQLGAINSATFAVRAPLPGHLNYLQAIKYIDDGMQYVDPYSRFLVSPVGEICFYARPVAPQTVFDNYYRYWCVHPQSVSNVEAFTNGGGGISEVRIWCMHSYPHCAHSLDYSNVLSSSSSISNNITVQIIPSRQERSALEDLIFVMGGNAITPG
jgi:hypothetical protein